MAIVTRMEHLGAGNEESYTDGAPGGLEMARVTRMEHLGGGNEESYTDGAPGRAC